MRKTVLLFALFAFGLTAFAQKMSDDGRCILEGQMGSNLVKVADDIGDFSITDSDGVTWNLYQTLAEGKTVFLDLFYSTWSSCQAYASLIEDVYVNTGSGQQGILFWGLSPTDNNAQINAYKAQYGITNPCAGTQGGGPAAIDITISGQTFYGYPTYCVVCPDHTLYFDVCWPPTEQCFYPYFEMCAPAISANFTSDIQDVCQYGTVQFDDLSVGSITSWQWTFEGGTPATSTSQNPQVTYNTVGTFDVTLTVTGSSGNSTYTAPNFIEVFALPVVTLAPFSPVPLNTPAFALTGGLPAGGNYSGPGVTNNMFYPAVAGVGTHTITYTFTDGNGCSDNAQQSIVVTPEGGEYCVPGANCSYGDGFTDFAFAGIENYESGCSPAGYGDFTSMTGTVEIGYVFTAQMQTGYDDQFVSMWVDFNDNFEFETWERIVTDFSLTTAGVLTPLDILIPGNSLPGTHRMRIGSNWQANSSPDPCATFNYGEWEDYTLVVNGTPISNDALVLSIDMNATIQTGNILPKATVKNNGTQTISFPVVCSVPSAGYTSTVQVTDLGLGQQIQVTFDTWAATGGIYTLEVCTQLTGDELPGNDCMTKEIAVLNYDVGVLAVNMGAIVMLGDITPKATVKNFGFETVTFPVTMVSEDAGYSSTVEVANLAPGEQLVVSFETWSNSLGQFAFEACAELSLDENPDNNCSEMLVTVSEDARQKVVMEIATGTWWGYCPYAMAGADQLHQENPQTFVVIEWHDGDEFEFPQSTQRINYYGITGFPTAVFDGIEQFVGGYTPSSYPYYVPIFEGRIGTPSNYSIDLDISETDGTTFDVTATVEILEGNTTEALSLLMVLTETDVPAIGAENQNFVARAVYPDLNGTPIDFSTQTTQTVTQTVTVEDTYVYENCEIVVFLQNLTTREIYQGTSKMMTEITGIQEPVSQEEISIYPNPAHGAVNIKSSSQIQKVSVYNPSGQLVFEGNANTGLYHLSTQQLNAGLYLFKVETVAGVTTQRVVIQ